MEHKKIEALSNRLPGQYKSLAKFASHCFSVIDESMDYHRRLVAMNAIAGIKPDASEEKAYLSTISELKCLILAEMEKQWKKLNILEISIRIRTTVMDLNKNPKYISYISIHYWYNRIKKTFREESI
ncbi:hypothetical protein SFC65_20415 [Priestia filamentosa]|uniref:hypothetical protein n=1 Tax=Priestia filamentosa TaxID=1402861 RepID=UPI003981B982